VNTSQPASARFAQSYVFTVNDAFVFIFSVGGHQDGFASSPRIVFLVGTSGWRAYYPSHLSDGPLVGGTGGAPAEVDVCGGISG
jgi:hypothetical protein